VSTNNVCYPGDLRHRVSIVSSSVTPDGIGGGSRTATTLATVWARIEPTSSREVVRSGGTREQTWWRVTMRYPDSFTVTGDMRVVWNGRTFYIKGIMQSDAVTRWLVLDVMEGE
jgi:SPP1 family predicted phage head-tail adaptor